MIHLADPRIVQTIEGSGQIGAENSSMVWNLMCITPSSLYSHGHLVQSNDCYSASLGRKKKVQPAGKLTQKSSRHEDTRYREEEESSMRQETKMKKI